MTASRGSNGSDTVRCVVAALKVLLRQQVHFIESLSDAEYAQQADEFTSSIGCHLRHTLDHVCALVRGTNSGMVDYDARDRGLTLERDRDEARRQTLDWICRLDDVCLEDDRSLYVRSVVNAHGAEVVTRSSLARELAFVLSHTIHHHAMMASAARSMGAQAPAEFGVAPATLADRASASCVPSAS